MNARSVPIDTLNVTLRQWPARPRPRQQRVNVDAAGRSYGERLRAARRAAGLSRPALAERAGVGLETLSNTERGYHEPQARTLGLLARALGVSMDALWLGTEAP